ncbi:Centrosomal protein of 120 kDa, partial [Geodia barretti]
MHLFVISVTLDNPSGLPESLSPYYYNYNLLDVDIASEQFVYNEFKTEKASIRILCSRERLRKLLSLKQRMKITLCQSDQFLGKGSLSLKPLLTDDVLKCEVEMGIESESASFVDVTLEVQKDNSSLPTIKDIDHTENRLFVKRSLARCFEAVSDVKTSLSDYSLSQEQNELCPATPDVSPFIVDSAEIEQTVPKTVRSSASDNLSPFEEVVRNSPHQEFRTVHNCEAVAGLQKNNGGANTTSTEPVSKNRLKSTWEHLTSSTDSCVHPVQDDLSFSSNINVPVHRVHVSTQTELSSESITPSPYAISRSCLSGECEESGNAIHQYQFSIEIHSIHNINLEEGLKCCVRFRYPFFGSQQPVVVQPPVSLVLGGENYFSASTYSFVFACSEDSLHNQLYCHPILLEVLMERGNCHSLVGIAQVPLGEVLKNEKVSLGNDVYQRCSLKVPVSAVVSQLTCAFVHCTLTLEYQKGFPPAETQGLPSASEYLAATELEMWKASEEETFTKEMKKKEACYLFQLQEEWERREKERQAVFTQKFQAYNCLEVQLRNTLEAAQCEQRKLLSRETELQQLYRKLSFEEQSIAKQCQAKVMQCQLLYEGKLEVQREKTEELLKTVERLKSQVSELSARLTSKDAEFDEYKQKVISKPESRLQAELIMVHIEKTELEKKLSTALRAKKHYKDQWTQAMKELAAYRHNELKSAQSILQRQQQELESVKIHSEEQKIIRKDLTQVKEEVSSCHSSTWMLRGPSLLPAEQSKSPPDH